MLLDSDTDGGRLAGTGDRLVGLLGSGQGERDGPYLVVDLGGVFEYLRGGDVESLFEEATTELTEEETEDGGGRRRSILVRLLVVGLSIAVSYALRSRFRDEKEPLEGLTEGIGVDQGGTDPDTGSDGGGGRGIVSKLVVGGVVLGAGLVLRRRFRRGTVDDTAAEGAEDIEGLAQKAAQVVRQRGEMVAERIEMGSESAAEQLETGGEEIEEEIEERFDEAGEAIEEAEDQAVGTDDSTEGTDDSTEGTEDETEEVDEQAVGVDETDDSADETEE